MNSAVGVPMGTIVTFRMVLQWAHSRVTLRVVLVRRMTPAKG